MRNPGSSDYEAELKIIEDDIAELEKTVFLAPVNSERETRYVYRLYQRTALNGDLRELRETEALINRVIQRIGPAEDLCLLKANLDFKLHRLAETKRDLAMAPALANRQQGRTLLAEIAFQEGDYAAARAALEDLAKHDPSWDVLARLAHIEGKMGDPLKADRWYLAAEDELSAKEMRSFAWLELQRGLLKLAYGSVEEALAHYQCADRAYTGHWLPLEHIADALAAQDKQAEANALYEQVLARVDKPEVAQKLGLRERALTGFLDSAQRGEVHYYHHLTECYTGAEAIYWARKDIALRDNFHTQTALAWALHEDGQTSDALPYLERALRSGVHDAGIFHKAAQIYEAAGFRAKAHRYEHKASVMNPLHVHAHVH